MNWYIFLAGLLALLAIIAHFTVEKSNFLEPMLEAKFDDVPKRVMLSTFHFTSVFLLLSTILLISVGIGVNFGTPTNLAVEFAAANAVLFGLVQVTYALTSPLVSRLTVMFQWVFWLGIGALAWVGAVLG